MQQRRLRLGDILDDYCPRERRITNHAVVAMIEDEVRLTRCTTCDAEHEYKQARVPVSRRRKPSEGILAELAGRSAASLIGPPARPDDDQPPEFPLSDAAPADLPRDHQPDLLSDAVLDDASEDSPDSPPPAGLDDEGPVHRRLIRATLPRPEGQMPERKAPDFTIRQPSNGRFETPRKERRRSRGHRQGGGGQHGHPMRFGNAPHGQGSGPHGAPQGRHRNRAGGTPGNTTGSRGGRPGGTQWGPQRPGGNQGRKRGR